MIPSLGPDAEVLVLLPGGLQLLPDEPVELRGLRPVPLVGQKVPPGTCS